MHVVAARFEDANSALSALARLARRIGTRPPSAGIGRLAYERAGRWWTATVAAARVRDRDVPAALDELEAAGGVIVAQVDADAVELPPPAGGR